MDQRKIRPTAPGRTGPESTGSRATGPGVTDSRATGPGATGDTARLAPAAAQAALGADLPGSFSLMRADLPERLRR